LTAAQRLALAANMDLIRAEEFLQERGSELTADSLGKLTELVTGSKRAGELARARRILQREREKSNVG